MTLVNMGTNTDFDAAFSSAKAKWESVIKCGFSDIAGVGNGISDWFTGQFSSPYNADVDDLVIGFSMEPNDGVNGTLGFAGARYLRPGKTSPISGIMKFDEADFASMSYSEFEIVLYFVNGVCLSIFFFTYILQTCISIDDAEIIILHEMGHILGAVNLQNNPCHSTCSTGNYNYGWASGCTLASTEYAALGLGLGPLLVENDGGGGTSCAHWEESSFPQSTGSSELMTGYFEASLFQPLTRVTIAALDETFSDYVVDYSVADPYPVSSIPMSALVSNEGPVRQIYKPDTTFTIADRMMDLEIDPIELPAQE